eukprot:Hpha_TRINITY_DN6946_c0_g1::TRINITY_DN6946_c0_g1_i1::g.139452::m.139452
MTGLLIFVRMHPACGGGDDLIPVEVDPTAGASDVMEELRKIDAVRGEMALEWQGKRLAPGDLLADMGVCPQSTVSAVPLHRKRQRIGGGNTHCCALLPDGTVRCWGREGQQCKVPDCLQYERVIEVSAGNYHTVCLLDNGEIVCWGANAKGQCTVPRLGRKALQVSAGGAHSLALIEGGRVISWGGNGEGQFPYGGVAHIAGGGLHSVAVLCGGTIRCWGSNGATQCDTPQLGQRVVQVSAGGHHSAAVLEDGSLVCWGRNKEGQCSPPLTLGKVKMAAAGGRHTLAITEEGSNIVAWGYNNFKQCNVPNVNKAAVEVAAGYDHSIALLEDGTIICWGYAMAFNLPRDFDPPPTAVRESLIVWEGILGWCGEDQ